MFDPNKLSTIMIEKGFDNIKLAETMNNLGTKIGSETIRKYKQGTITPSMTKFCMMVDILDIAEQDLFETLPRKRKMICERYGEEGEKMVSKGNCEIQLQENVIAIPMIMTGAGAEALADLTCCENIYIEKSFFDRFPNNKNIIAVKVIGNSMEDDFKENDVVLVELVKNQNFVRNDGIYLVRYGDIVQLKQVQFLGNNEILLRSSNEKYTPINPTKDYGIEWEILGKPLIKLIVEYYSDIQYSIPMK